MLLWKASSTIMFRANLRSLKAATANFINPRKHTVAQLPYTQRHMPMEQEEARKRTPKTSAYRQMERY